MNSIYTPYYLRHQGATSALTDPALYHNTLKPISSVVNAGTLTDIVNKSVHGNPEQGGLLNFNYVDGQAPYGPVNNGGDWVSDVYNWITKYTFPYRTPLVVTPPPVEPPPVVPPPVDPPVTPPDPFNDPDDMYVNPDNKGAWGDPHFHFTDSTGKSVTIDHKGIDGETYNILNADGLDIDAEYKRYKDPKNPQLMGAIRVNAGNQQLIMHEGKVLLDGEEIRKGTSVKLKDGRTIEISNKGSVDIKTLDDKGVIKVKYQNGYYDIDPEGNIGVNTKNSYGGILGYLMYLGQHVKKQEILERYDTNKNGKLDNDDDKIATAFTSVSDIGFYSYN